MKIELVTFVSKLTRIKRLDLTAAFINESAADLILFPGHTLKDGYDIEALKQGISNKAVEAVLELEGVHAGMLGNILYRLSEGAIINTYSHQYFATSKEIEGNYHLADSFINELVTKRAFNLGSKNFLVLQCGEINLFKNLQSKANKVEFRLQNDKLLLSKLKSLLQQTDVILNPSHTPMGNQGKMAKRREFLSRDNKYYFSTSNTPEGSKSLKLKSLQYALYNQEPMQNTGQKVSELAISRTYSLL